MGAQALACNLVYHARTKHIELDVHFVRNLISNQKLEVRYVPTELQPANLFTKALPQPRFMMLRTKLTMTDSMPSLRGPVDQDSDVEIEASVLKQSISATICSLTNQSSCNVIHVNSLNSLAL